MFPKSTEELTQQLGEQRRTVDFDTFDIQVQELLRMLTDGQISVAPVYQRQFRWDNARCSELIESLLLGIPIPNLFMATNTDNTWEVVDGVQRLSSVVKFAGNKVLRDRLELKGGPLKLEGLRKIAKFNDLTFEDLPPNIQQHFKTRPLKVVTLNDKSDKILRIDLFERLNTGGIALTNQEIRDCVFYGPFADFLGTLAKLPEFHTVVQLTAKQDGDGTREECVLRFFALLDEYQEFEHSVKGFLDDYMRSASKHFNLNRDREFSAVFQELARAFPHGILRPGGKGRTPLALYDGIAVGAALALKQRRNLSITGLNDWLNSPELREFTTGATNDRSAVRGRIEFCRDRFSGIPYVPTATN